MWPVWDYPALCQGREIAHPEPNCDTGWEGSWLGGAGSAQDLVCYWQPLACVSTFLPSLRFPILSHLRNVFLPWSLAISLPPLVSVRKLREESDVPGLRVLSTCS